MSGPDTPRRDVLADALGRLLDAQTGGDASATRAAQTELNALMAARISGWLTGYRPQPHPHADGLAAAGVADVADGSDWPQRPGAVTWGGMVDWLAALADADADRIAAAVDGRLAAIGWPRAASTVGGMLQLCRPGEPPWPFPDVPPTLPDTWLVSVDVKYRVVHAAAADPAALPGYPLRPFFEAYADARRADARALVVASSPGYVRQPDALATAALATWTPAENLPDVRAVMVDGEPMATETLLQPARAVRPDGQLFALPGTRDAGSLILQRLKAIDAAGVDRRAAMPADTYATLALACALTGSATLEVAAFGAWLGGRDVADVRNAADMARLRGRAWAALDAARAHFVLDDGNRVTLLDVSTVNLPIGTVRLTGWDWGRARAHGLGHWTLTGALAHIGIRADGYGSMGRFVAALEDWAAHGTPASRADRRSRWLVPIRPGGPGPWVTVGAMDLLARAGYVWQAADAADHARMRKLWQRIRGQLDARGYRVAHTAAESQAGDTVEIRCFGDGRGSTATVTARASARFCAAVALTAADGARRPRGVDRRGFDGWPLARILAGMAAD